MGQKFVVECINKHDENTQIINFKRSNAGIVSIEIRRYEIRALRRKSDARRYSTRLGSHSGLLKRQNTRVRGKRGGSCRFTANCMAVKKKKR